jgi:Zn-dependent protease
LVHRQLLAAVAVPGSGGGGDSAGGAAGMGAALARSRLLGPPGGQPAALAALADHLNARHRASKGVQKDCTALYLLLFVGVHERFFLEVCKAGILTNVVMFVFNLFPLPPLDGGRIAVGLLPMKQAIQFSRIEPWGFYIVMALVLFGVINGIWMQPFMGLTLDTLRWLMTPVEWLLG